MTTLVSRLFASANTATAAHKALRAKGIQGGDIARIEGEEAAALAAIRARGIPLAAARPLAAHVGKGQILLIVLAPFGLSGKVARLLDSFDPVDAGAAQADVFIGTQNSRPLPVNRALPTLLDSDSLIFSGRILPHVTKIRTPFSSMFGLPLLSSRKGPKDNLIAGSTTPFSSALGLKLLTGGKGPRASVIRSNTTPFSSAVGMRTISK